MKSYFRGAAVVGLSLLFFTSTLLKDTGAQPTSVSHESFDVILKEYVHDGVVDYEGLKRNEELLDKYLGVLDWTDPSSLDRNGQIAFWINAYNAFTLKLILNRYPGIVSIKDIPSNERWKAMIWRVNGRAYSLDHIEHSILRKMGEPRIHFTIVCASLSCPDLRSEAYVSERLEEQLSAAAKSFLANQEMGLKVSQEKGRLWGVKHTLFLSSIFKWFKEDFVGVSGSVVDFILPYIPEEAKEFILEHKKELTIRYLDYDWDLNGK